MCSHGHCLAGLPCRLWSPSGDMRGPPVYFEVVDVLCSGKLHFSHIADYVYEFCLLSDPDIGTSILVCDVEHTPLRFGRHSRKFVPCMSLYHNVITGSMLFRQPQLMLFFNISGVWPTPPCLS